MFYVDVAELHVLRNGIILDLILSFKMILINFLGSLTHNNFLGMKNLQTTVLSVCFVSTCSTTNRKFPCSKFLAGKYHVKHFLCNCTRYYCTYMYGNFQQQKQTTNFVLFNFCCCWSVRKTMLSEFLM